MNKRKRTRLHFYLTNKGTIAKALCRFGRFEIDVVKQKDGSLLLTPYFVVRKEYRGK